MSTAKTLAFVDGMDNINKKNKQFTETENGHEAYSWNNNENIVKRAKGWNDDKISVKSVKEKFVQLYFQCVLNKKPVVNDNIVLQNKFEELINSILSLKTEKKQKRSI